MLSKRYKKLVFGLIYTYTFPNEISRFVEIRSDFIPALGKYSLTFIRSDVGVMISKSTTSTADAVPSSIKSAMSIMNNENEKNAEVRIKLPSR